MIYIPSYKRPTDCLTARVFKSAVICCHEFEAEEYRKNNTNKILVMPDSICGQGMAKIRNWIVDHAEEEYIVLMDDDIASMGYYEGKQRYEYSDEEWQAFIVNAFVMCEEAGTVLWGVNLLEDKKAYREYSPFSFLSIVLGPCMGIILRGNNIRFDEELGLKEDYDYALQVLNKHRRILRFNKVHYRGKHIKGSGGCIAYRTSEKEEQQRKRFQEKWGSRIVKFKQGDINPIIQVPINGI